MSDGYNVLQGLIGKLRELGQAPEAIAADIAPELREALEENIAASRAPDGTPWRPTQRGNAPLANAGAALGVAAVKTRVLAVVQGIEASHHYGHVRGKIARPILPGSNMPPQIVELIARVARQRFQLIVGGS